MHDQTLENVLSASEMHSPHSSAIVEMFVPAFQLLTPLPQQKLSSASANATAIGVHRLLFALLLLPALAAAVRLRTIGANISIGQSRDHCPAVIALVGHNLGRTFRVHPRAVLLVVGCFRRIRDPLARLAIVSTMDFVSPSSAACTVTATIAPV